MSRYITIAAAQLGPIEKDHSRESVVERLIAMLHQAVSSNCKLVVFPELALTTFFPVVHRGSGGTRPLLRDIDAKSGDTAAVR